MPKHLIFAAFAAAAMLTVCAQAQDGASSPDTLMQVLAARLNLSDAQKSVIAPVIADRQQKLKTLRDEGAAPRGRRREARSILAESDKQINAVLSPEQQRQYKELEAQLIERLRQRAPAQ